MLSASLNKTFLSVNFWTSLWKVCVARVIIKCYTIFCDVDSRAIHGDISTRPTLLLLALATGSFHKAILATIDLSYLRLILSRQTVVIGVLKIEREGEGECVCVKG